MNVLKKLAGETALYGLSSIVARVLNYFLVPLHTGIFAQDEYGVYTLFYSYVAFLNILYTYGLETTYFRFASKADSPEKTQHVYQTILSSILLSTLLFSILFFSFSGEIAQALGYPNEQHLITWLLAVVAIDAILAIPYARLRQEQKAKQFAFTKIVNIGLNVFLNVFFLIFCRNIYQGDWLPSWKPWIDTFYDPHLGIGYIILANLIANAFVFILLFRSFLDFRFRFRWAEYKPMLIYAIPLLFTGFAGMINSTLGNILLEQYLPKGFYPGLSSIDAVGIYGACFKLSVFMTLAIQAFKYAVEPFFFSRASDREAPALFAHIMRYFIIVGVILWIGVSLNLDILKRIFLRDPAYWEGIGVVPILLLGQLFLGIYFNLSVWFKLTDRTYFGLYIASGGASLTILGNIFLIPILGYTGSALTVLISYLGMAITSYFIGQKYFPVPYQMASALKHIVLGGLIIIVSFYLSPSNLWLYFLLNSSLILAYLVYLFITEKKNFLKQV